MTHLEGEASLLQLIETAEGRAQLAEAFEATPPLHDPDNRYRDCLDRLAPGWHPPAPGQPDTLSTTPGWTEVIADVRRVPALVGKPGTDEALSCRTGGSDTDDWDITMAHVMRIWGLLRAGSHERLFDLRDIPDADKQQKAAEMFAQLRTDVAERAWLQGSKQDVDATVCIWFGVRIPETENHEWLIRTTRFLHNESLPVTDVPGDSYVAEYVKDSDFHNGTNGLDSYIHGFLNDILAHDWREYNSRPYRRLQMLGLLNLFDFAQDVDVRQLAAKVLDFMAVKQAAESMDNQRIAPFRRKKDHDNDKLYDDSDSMYTVWVGGLLQPVYLQGGGPGNVSVAMTLAASSGYRPPDWVRDLMISPAHRHYLQDFNGQGQHERAYGGPDFVITGGGLETDCPYPASILHLCKGSGNDEGTSEPIVLIPHRTRTSAGSATPVTTDYPSYHDEIHIPAVDSNNCIGKNFACGYGPIMIPPALLHDSSCTDRRSTTVPNPLPGDVIEYDVSDIALRIDEHCQGDRYKGDCIFVYTSSAESVPAQPPGLPAAYLVTHSCSANANEADTDRAFRAFVSYMRTVGQPSNYGVLPDVGLPPRDVVDLTGITTREEVDYAANGAQVAIQGSLTLTGGQYPTTSSALTAAAPGTGFAQQSAPASTSYYQQPVSLVTSITSAASGQGPMTGTVTFLDAAQVLGSAPVTATTTSSGQARLTVGSLGVGIHHITAVYNGDSTFVSSAADIVLTVRKAPTTFDLRPIAAVYRNQVALTATLTNAITATPISGRAVTLTVSDGTTAQSCPATTDTNGAATCVITPVTIALGHDTITADFTGDAFYEPTTNSVSAIVFAFLDSGAFVLGDKTATGKVTFWGSQWAKLNQATGGATPSAFKGFADTTSSPPMCEASWSTDPGNSPPPPPAQSIPTYMGVLVTSHATDTSSEIIGDTVHIAVVHTDPGYAPDPSNPGRGTVITTFC